MKTIHDIELHVWDGSENIWPEYARLLSKAYNKDVSSSMLENKHLFNPCGKSLISFAKVNDKIVAARALWRMYDKFNCVYQPCDTVTDKEYQGRGLFKGLTNLAIQELPLSSLVFNFPNEKSLPGYLKLGWELYGENYKCINFGIGSYQKVETDIIKVLHGSCSDDFKEYMKWRFGDDIYSFVKLKNGILIDNGAQCGFYSFDGTHSDVKMKGFSQGYTLKPNRKIQVSSGGGAIYLKCNSKTVLLNLSNNSFEKMRFFLKGSDVNVYMDTF
jgi:hypothetical protein